MRRPRLLLAPCSALIAAACATAPVEVPIPPPEEPVAVLLKQLSSADPTVRAAAAWKLAGADESVSEVRSVLLDLADDEDRSVRYSVCWALAHISDPQQDSSSARQYDIPPKRTHVTRPRYPQAAFEKKLEGTVLVELLIGEEGEVAHAEVRRSIPGLDEAALACARQWHFEPAMRSGEPVPTIAHAPVAFRIY